MSDQKSVKTTNRKMKIPKREKWSARVKGIPLLRLKKSIAEWIGYVGVENNSSAKRRDKLEPGKIRLLLRRGGTMREVLE